MPSEGAGSDTASVPAGQVAERDGPGSDVAERDGPESDDATPVDTAGSEGAVDDDAATGNAATGDAATGNAATDTIEWGPVRHDRIRSLVVGFGLAVALVWVAVGVFLAATVGSALASVSPGGVVSALAGVSLGETFVSVVFVLALALLTVPYLYLFSDDWELGSGSLGDRLPGFPSLRPGWVLLGASAPVAVWLLGIDWTGLGVWPLVAWLWVVPLSLLWQGVEVQLDPSTHEVRRRYPTQDRGRTDDLDAVIRMRRVDLPRAGTVFLLAYRGNAWYRSTPWLTVPRERADAVERALNEVLARSTGPSRASVPVRTMLALIGCSTLVLGGALSVAGEGGAAVALAVLSAPFTLLFLALAARL